MAGLDYAGLLTGISPQSAKIDPFSLPTAGQQRMAFGAQQAQGVQRAGEGLFKLQSGSPQEIAKTEMYKLDRADPQYEAKAAELVERNKTIEAAGLRASSMAQALEASGHEDLAKQVELGDVDAYKRGLELISPEKGKTSIED
jgi:hypothetical protein